MSCRLVTLKMAANRPASSELTRGAGHFGGLRQRDGLVAE